MSDALGAGSDGFRLDSKPPPLQKVKSARACLKNQCTPRTSKQNQEGTFTCLLLGPPHPSLPNHAKPELF